MSSINKSAPKNIVKNLLLRRVCFCNDLGVVLHECPMQLSHLYTKGSIIIKNNVCYSVKEASAQGDLQIVIVWGNGGARNEQY